MSSARDRHPRNSQIADEDLANLAHKCARYIMCRVQNDIPVKKTEIKNYVLQGIGGKFDDVMGKVSVIFEKTYGVQLVTFTEGPQQYYIPLSRLQLTDKEKENDDPPEDSNKILLMLVLTHIFMSKNAVTDASLHAFLSSLNIDTDKKDHKLFGNVSEYINTLVKRKYLKIDIEDVTKKPIYSWGVRSELTVSKEKILMLVSKIYGNMQQDAWGALHEEATEQNLAVRERSEVAQEGMDD